MLLSRPHGADDSVKVHNGEKFGLMSTYEGQGASQMQFDEGSATKPPVI